MGGYKSAENDIIENDLTIIRDFVASYRRAYCPHCETETIAIKRKAGTLELFLSATRLHGAVQMADRKHNRTLCLKCMKMPLKGMRIHVVILAWVVVSFFTLVCVDTLISAYHENRSLAIASLVLCVFVAGHLILFRSLFSAFRTRRAEKAVIPFTEGDPCFFCGEALAFKGSRLLCPACKIKVER